MSEIKFLEVKNEPKSKGQELVKKVAIFGAGIGVGVALSKIFNRERWVPGDLVGKDLNTKIEILIELNLSSAGDAQMRQWRASASVVLEETLLALAEKYQLKKQQQKPVQIAQHLFDRKLIGEELRDKLRIVINCRNQVTHEDPSTDTLQNYFRQFDDVLPVLQKRL